MRLPLLMPFEVRVLETALRERRPLLVERFGEVGVRRLAVHARRERALLDWLQAARRAA